jgi:predicted nucleic acid-binding protein
VTLGVHVHGIQQDVGVDELHAPARMPPRRWLDGPVSGQDTVAFAWIALLAFVRLCTKDGLFPAPLSPAHRLARGALPTHALEPVEVVVERHDRATVLERQRCQVRVVDGVAADAHAAQDIPHHTSAMGGGVPPPPQAQTPAPHPPQRG